MGLPPSHNICYIIDFGLARRFALPNGDVRPVRDFVIFFLFNYCYSYFIILLLKARDETGFRGTARYASIYSHQSKDLGRRDDLWSLFYMMIELIEGELPWRRINDKVRIKETTQKAF